MADLHFELVTPERLVRSENVYMVVVPGTEGDFGVLAGHAPTMSTLRNGDIAIYRGSMADTPERIPVESGFAEVNERGLTVLAERIDVDAEGAPRAAAPRAPEGVGRH
jgi:F-type H+-transporting ATPase subunit epsilon